MFKKYFHGAVVALAMLLSGSAATAVSLWGNEVINTVVGPAGAPVTGEPGSTCGPSAPSLGWSAPDTPLPWGVAARPDGTLYVGDARPGAARIWKISPGQAPVVVISTGLLTLPRGLAVDADETVYVAESNANRVVKFPRGQQTPVRVAGTSVGGFDPALTVATSSPLASPSAVALGPDGSVYIADTNNHRIRKVSPAGIISVVAGSGAASSAATAVLGPVSATLAAITPHGMTVDGAGNIYLLDVTAKRIYRVSTAGTLQPVVGGGASTADHVTGTSAAITPSTYILGSGLAWDGNSGSLYYVDSEPGRGLVRKLAPNGKVYTVAGHGPASTMGSQCNGDGSPALGAYVAAPIGLAVDAAGSVYVGDGNNKRIRKIDASRIADGAGLVVTKTVVGAGPAVTAGRSVTFAVAVGNRGPAGAYELALVDKRSNNSAGTITMASSAWTTCHSSPAQADCQLAALPVGATATATVSVVAGRATPFCNVAQVVNAVSVHDGNVVASAPACIPVVPPFQMDDFVLLAMNSMTITSTVTVRTGLVGVNNRIAADGSSAVEMRITPPIDLGPRTGLVADTIEFLGSAEGVLPARVIANSPAISSDSVPLQPGAPAGSFPLMEGIAAPGAFVPGPAVNVAAGKRLVLPPGNYGPVTVQPGGVLFLKGYNTRAGLLRPETETRYHFHSLDIKSKNFGRGRITAGKLMIQAAPDLPLPSQPQRAAQELVQGVAVTVFTYVNLERGAWAVANAAGYKASSFLLAVNGSGVSDPAVRFGDGSRVIASVFAPGSAMAIGARFQGVGRFVGGTITVGPKSEFGRD